MQREAVVAGDEIDAGVRPAAAPFVEIAGAAKPRGELGDHAAVAFPELADRVAVLAVPFRPQGGKVAHLVAPFAQVPRLGDQLHLREHRVLVDDVEERRPACSTSCSSRASVLARSKRNPSTCMFETQ